MADLIQRKRAELFAKRRSLSEQLAVWTAASAAGQPLEKHSSQVRRLSAQLDGLLGKLDANLGRMGDDDWLRRGREIECVVLELHRVWEFFRAKLAQRHDPGVRPHL